MVLGSVLNPINSSMLAVVLVPIGRAFQAAPSQTAWLITGLYLATAVGQPVIGRLVDTYGPRRPYLLGTALVGAAGLLGTLAPNLWVLVAARVLLGIGTSAAYPASMSLLRSESERIGQGGASRVLATLSICNQIVVVIGPTLGGLLIGLGGWRLSFAVNVPVALACYLLGALGLPRTPRPTTATPTDSAAMLLFATTLTTFVLFLMNPAAAHWYLPVVTLAAGTLFARRELNVPEPFMDLRVLAGNTPLLATYGRQLLAYTTAYAYLYGFSQWLQEGRGLNAAQAGLLVMPMPVTALAVTAVARTPARLRTKLITGACTQLLCCIPLLFLGPTTPLWLLATIAAAVACG
ncbi:MFS transporter [Streptomyces sp. NPDC003832]